MAEYKTNEVIKSELEALNIGYDDDMTNKELQGLLDKATDAPEKEVKAKKKAPVAQAPEVTNGVGTINDHEKRIFALENAAK
jgi:hypothetical protein